MENTWARISFIENLYLYNWVLLKESGYSEEKLFEIEKKIIKKHKMFRHLTALPIIIVDDDTLAGENKGTEIHVSKQFLENNPTLEVVDKLLKHELIHSITPPGHGLDFLKKAKQLKIIGRYEYMQLISEPNISALEGRLKYSYDSNGDLKVDFRRQPSWKGFKEFIDGNPELNPGEMLSKLRKLYGLSLEYVSMYTGLSFDEVKSIECSESKNFYLDESSFRKIFWTIVKSKQEQ